MASQLGHINISACCDTWHGKFSHGRQEWKWRGLSLYVRPDVRIQYFFLKGILSRSFIILTKIYFVFIVQGAMQIFIQLVAV